MISEAKNITNTKVKCYKIDFHCRCHVQNSEKKKLKFRRHTFLSLFMTKAPIPTRCEAFAGRVSIVSGIHLTSIK